MNVTRRVRPVLAGARHGLSSALTAMVLVLTVVSAGVLCGGQVAVQVADHPVLAVETVSGPVGGDSPYCADHHSPSAQCDPLRAAHSPGPPARPEPSTSWFMAPAVHHDTLAPAGTAEATAPSLHALGISRT